MFDAGEQRSEKNADTVSGDCPGSVEKGPSQRARLTGANKRMFNLLRKAKVQLIKIDQQKQLKSSRVRMRRHRDTVSNQTLIIHCFMRFMFEKLHQS